MVTLRIAALALAVSSVAVGGELRIVVVDQGEAPYQLGSIWVHRTMPKDPAFYDQLAVGPDGQATIELSPGEYEARWDTRDSIRPIQVLLDNDEVTRYGKFVHHPQGPMTMRNANFTISDGAVLLKFVVPNLETHRLTGEVATAEGAPIANLRFDLHRDGVMNCARCALTDEDGRFEFVCRKFPIRLVPRDTTGSWVFDPPELVVEAPTQETLHVTAVAR